MFWATSRILCTGVSSRVKCIVSGVILVEYVVVVSLVSLGSD